VRWLGICTSLALIWLQTKPLQQSQRPGAVAATGSTLSPRDECDHRFPVVERLDGYGLGDIGPTWLGRKGRGGNSTFAGDRSTRDGGLPVPVVVDPLELSEVLANGSQVVEDRALAIVHTGVGFYMIEADRVTQLMAERVTSRGCRVVFVASTIQKGVVHLDRGRLDVPVVEIELRQTEPTIPGAVFPVTDLNATGDRIAVPRVGLAINLVQGDRVVLVPVIERPAQKLIPVVADVVAHLEREL
jgi:hypothetical protein